MKHLKGDRAGLIVGMIIDLSIAEIQSILKSYDLLCIRVNQADEQITLQQQQQ